MRDPALLAELRGTVDVVVSNPPYVPATTPVDPEVPADPAEAVFAGADGLDADPDDHRPGGRTAAAPAACWCWSTTTRTARPSRPAAGRRPVDGRRRPPRSEPAGRAS